MKRQHDSTSLTRRIVLSAAGSLALSGTGLFFSQAWASPEVEQTLKRLFGSKIPADSPRLKLHMPKYAYDGSRVPFSVEVKSPMTESNYVREVHVLAERNPFPRIASFQFHPEQRQGIRSNTHTAGHESECDCRGRIERWESVDHP